MGAITIEAGSSISYLTNNVTVACPCQSFIFKFTKHMAEDCVNYSYEKIYITVTKKQIDMFRPVQRMRLLCLSIRLNQILKQ
ncbi:hypothetical protein Bhyg_02098 [Pseudolycoriella hygida]|uniref:Uncharacterized protein n=1 Tax=Pseudolycoriella hygida TaxID=35572 RepID=A0A9Q0S6D2_9DIPT|nr:hypothetical protein Bhyg_02098 [Pseudolycoriella hygida]